MPMLCVQGRPSSLFWVGKSVLSYNKVLYVVLHIESRVIMCRSKYFWETQMSDKYATELSEVDDWFRSEARADLKRSKYGSAPKGGPAKGPSQFSMGRRQAKSLLTQKPSASVPLGGMNWGNILTRGGLKMLGVIGGIMSPRTAGAPSVDDWKKDDENAVYKDSYLTGNINTAGPADWGIRHNERETRKKHGLPKRKQNY